MEDKQIPDIDFYMNGVNPTIKSPKCYYEIGFYATRESLVDPEEYNTFVNSCKGMFRKLPFYNSYKSYLYGLGLNRCQMLGNITSEMANIEMHHVIPLEDIIVIIMEHMFNNGILFTSFDIVNLLVEEHKNNRIPMVMLCESVHQAVENLDNVTIHPDACFGYWVDFLNEYHDGITKNIAFKLIHALNESLKKGCSDHNGVLALRDTIYRWSELNNYYE